MIAEASIEGSMALDVDLLEASSLTEEEEDRYRWQLWVPGFGREGQQRLKRASVLISRAGGVGGAAAMYLAAAGVGRLIIAHGGNLRRDDLNRQMLMGTSGLGQPRIERIRRSLREINPHVEVVTEAANIHEDNAARLADLADLIIDAAPLFEERHLLNRESLRRKIPMVEAAMYAMEGTVTTFLPGFTPCLRCLTDERPEWWKRQFPVLGAVSGTIGSLAAIEAIKVLAGLGQPLAGRLLLLDLGRGSSRTLRIYRDPNCPACGGIGVASPQAETGVLATANQPPLTCS